MDKKIWLYYNNVMNKKLITLLFCLLIKTDEREGLSDDYS